MELHDITNTTHPMYPAARELYQISFPFHEQREAPSQAAILQSPDYHFGLLYDGEVFVGLALYWETEDFLYIEHLCIQPALRNRRYGQQALALLQEKGKPVILEIDPPVEELAKRRKGFYERCGFAAVPFPHVHPPYHRESKGHDLVIMSAPRPVTRAEYDRFAAYLRETVMDRAFD